MAGGRLHPRARVDGSAVGAEHANGNGSTSAAPDVTTRGEATDELERALTRLERANQALERENARLARGVGGQAGAATAAAVRTMRAERRWSERLEAAELEAERLRRLLATPRHRAVERARQTLMRSRFLYPPVRRAWAWLAAMLGLRR